MANESRQWLYKTLKDSGLNVGASYEEFDKLMETNEDSRKWCFEQARKLGHNVGKDYAEFDSLVGPSRSSASNNTAGAVKQQPVQTITPQPVAQPVSSQPADPQPQNGVAAAGPANEPIKPEPVKQATKKTDPAGSKPNPWQMDWNGEGQKMNFNPQSGKFEEQAITPPLAVPEKPQREAKDMPKSDSEILNGKINDVESRIKANEDALRDLYNKDNEEKDKEASQGGFKGFLSNLARSIGEANRNMHPTPQGKEAGTALSDKDSRARTLMAENNTLSQTLRTLKAQRDLYKSEGFFDTNNFTNIWQGMKDASANPDIWFAGVTQLSTQSEIANIKTKMERGKQLTEDENNLAVAAGMQADANMNADLPHGYTAGQITAEMVPFMAETAMNPAHGLGKATALGMTKAMARKYGVRGALPAIARGAARVAGDAAEAGILATTVQAPKMLADAKNRENGQAVLEYDDEGKPIVQSFEGGKSKGRALYEGIANMTVENYTELLGEQFGFINKGIGKLAEKGLDKVGLSSVTNMFRSAGASKWANALKKLEDRVQFNGFVGEVMEEEVNIPLNAWLVGDEQMSNLTDVDNQIDILLGIGLSCGAFSALRTASYGAGYGKAKKRLNETEHIARTRLTRDVFDPLRERIDSADDKEMVSILDDVMKDDKLHDIEKKAVMEYAKALENYRGYNLFNAKKTVEGEVPAPEVTMNSAYQTGYDAETPEEKRRIKNNMVYQEGNARTALGLEDGDDVKSWLGNYFGTDDRKEMLSMLKDSDLDENQKSAVADFLNASEMSDAMMKRVDDDIELEVNDANDYIDRISNKKTGKIQKATLKQDDVEVFIVDGNVVMMDDGSMVDTSASDNDVLVYNPTKGKTEMIDVFDILNVGELEDAEENRRRMEDYVRRDSRERALAEINGTVAMTSGNAVNIIGKDGAAHRVVIIGLDDEDNVQVNIDGNSNATYTRQELQDAADSYEKMNFGAEMQAEKENASASEEEDAGSSEGGESGATPDGSATNEEAQPDRKYGEGFITINENGKQMRAVITRVTKPGEYEVYTSEPIRGKSKIAYLTEEELDKIGSDFEASPQSEENEGSVTNNGENVQNTGESVQNTGENVQNGGESVNSPSEETSNGNGEKAHLAASEITITPEDLEGVEDKERFKEAFDNQSKSMASMTDEELKKRIGELDGHDDTITDYGRGCLVRMKKELAAREGAQAQEEAQQPEQVPEMNGAEPSVNNDTEQQAIEQQTVEPQNNEQLGAEPASQAAEPSAMERIPKDESGQPLYEQTDTDTAWDAIVEQTEGDQSMAKAVAESMVKDKEEELKRAEKAKYPSGASVIEKINAEKMKRQAIDEAKKALDHWKRIASTGMRRDMDARAARDAEAKRIAEAKVAEEAATKAEREEAERKEREALNGVPDISVDTPADARARGYRRNGPQKVDRQQPIKAVTGKEVNIKFSDNAIPTGHVAVIEAEQLQPSHIQGNRNPAFFIDEAQPKNRKDESSVLSAKKIAENIRPEEITSSVTAYTGAPSVNARGEVIQGNNRSDALKLMWNSYPENGEAYKKYLADHADEFGIDAEELGKMQHPVLVNMIDADDKQAIELGQYVAQDTESGGVERIKAKNTVQKMGARIKNFASILLNGEEDESFAQLVDKNGAAVLKWLNKAGFISDTQVQSAIDRNGNVTAEATNDLKQMMYQSIFTDAPTRLEEMFGNLPVKAQKAVLATAFRDFDSNKDDRMTGEIQKSIIAYNSLISDSQFNNAKDEAEVRQAVEDWKRSYKFDDVSGESFLPSEEFSNFALELATMYRTKPQSHIQATFNEMYDIIQGAKKDTLFETADKTPKSLAAAIKQVLNINYDGNKRDLLLDSSAETGQEGQRGGDKDARIGEHAQEGEEPSERGEGTERNPITQKIGGSIFGDSSEFPETDLPNRVKQYLYDELPSCFRRAYFKTGFPKLGENNSEEILKGKVYDNFVKEAAESLPESTFDHVKEYLPTYFDYFYKKLDEAAAKKEDKSSVSSVDESKKEKEEKPSFIDAIHTIYTKGKELASKLFQRSFFVIADTPQFMKELGITGDKFTIKYGVIARHLNKDESHNLNEEEWSQLAEGLQHPFAISKVSNKDRGYRLYTTIKNKKGEYIVAGVDVKNAGRDIEVNAVSTVFGRRENANLTVVENVIYTDKNITPDQLALLDGPNFRQYPTDQELSTSGQQTLLNGPNSRQYSAEHEFSEDKGSEKTSDEQANSEKNDGYSIKSAEYTNKKGKKTDMYHLDFDSELTDKQKKALNAFAREKTGEGRFASSRGWADRENGGYYFRTEEDARKAAELIKDREAVEDAQPLSLDDIKEEPSKGNVQDEKNEADPSPTDAQKEAGNYRKGHRIVDGHKISIENEKGSTRSGVDADGTPWSVTMNNAYGYIRGTEGVDGDHIDVFLSDNPESGDVYVVDQVNPKTGEFDEHKVMYGFNSEDEAREAYLSNYSPGWKGLGNITRISREDFKEWIGSSRRKTKPFADYASVKKAEDGKDKKKSRWVDDEDAEEFARLRDILRKGLGNQLNSMFPANLIEPATKMSYLMMKHGVHKIQEYATAMIEELGEAIRPHIKSLYEFTRYTEEVQRSQWKDDLSSHEEVDAFDHIGFDSKKFGPVETAELITASQDSQAMMEAKERELKEKRNNIRKQKDEQRTADTEALAEQSEALASEAEDKLETIETAQDENAGNELAERIDRQIEAVNDQLALLGYYEADENGAFNESFGYMKTAEKKAVKDAEHLAMKLAADLGIDTGATKGKKKSKLAKADIAPAGGDITMRLPLNDGRELMVNIGLEPVSGRGGVRNETGSGLSNDNLEVTHVMYRVENPGAKDAFTRYGMNRWEEADVSYSKLLSGIRKEAGRYMPGAEANERKRSAEPGRQSENAIPQGASIEASNAERMKALEGEMADNENRQAEIEERLDNAGEEDELERDAMEGELAELQNKQKDLEAEYNGLKSMNEESEALEGFYDNVVDEDAVENLDADAAVQLAIVGVLNPALTDMKPTAAYKWLQDELKNVSDGKLRDLKREYMFKEDRDKLEDKVLDAVNAEVEHRLQDGENQRKYESSKADNTSKEQGKTADEQMREWAEQAERGETPFTVTPEVEEEIQAQRMAETPEAADERKKASKAKGRKKPGASSAEAKPVADLFGDLFEDNNGLTINNNENEKDELQPGTGESGRGRRQSVADESLGTRPGNETEGPDGRGVDRRSVGHPGNDEGGSERVSGSIESEKRLKPVAPAERMNTHNNRAERGTDYAPKGVDARIKANIAAIELMKRLTETGEAASPAQMAVLRKFSGWGGLGRAFDVHGVYDWNLRKLLGEEAYMDANMSRNSAYYTPAQVIDTMWDVVRAMGFKGGNVLEGSAGIGNILGLMPEDFSERSKIHAVEIDATTGGILSLLYPDAEVDVKGFEKTHVENGSVDLAITNVPFVTGLHVMDETGDKDLSKKFGDIHDFCIAKNVRKLREGGIGVFITSNGTLDNSTKLREWLTGEGGADVVGAFRLNNETFGGAAVTSDIIVVRKRVNGRASAHAIDVSTVTSERTAVMDTGETKRVKSKLEPIMKTVSMTYNKYFMEHPECMAGEMKFGFERGDTYRGGSKGLYPANGKDQTEMLAKWVEGFKNMDAEQPREADRTAEEVTYDDLGPGVKEGSMLIDSNGLLCVARRGKAVPMQSKRKDKKDTRTDEEMVKVFHKNKVKGHTRQECFKDYSKVKDALNAVLEYQASNEDDKGLKPLLDALNEAFDAFKNKYGNLHKNDQLAWLRNDMDYPSVLALETYEEVADKHGNKTARYGKTDIFTRRVVEKEQEPKPTNTKDGIIVSLYKYGRIDIPYLEETLGRNAEDIKRDIVDSGLGFEDPVSRDMVVSYEYLSGNVREKLRQAEESNKDGAYTNNVKALMKVIPDNIPAHLIDFTLGSSWVDAKLYEDFVKERTGVSVKFTAVGGTWFMKAPEYGIYSEDNRHAGVTSEQLHVTVYGHELMEAAIQNKTITVQKSHRNYDGTTETEVDKAATALCQSRIDEIRMDFKDWARAKMQGDEELSAKMEQRYNEQFNNSVPKSIPDEFIPEHFGGQAALVNGREFKLRPHQAKAAIRATTQPVMLAHEVGTGKTFTLITAAMEMRRLGTARKPMIVVQNATVGQFVESAKALYPTANVLTLDDGDHNELGRKNFYAKIKYNDWDMIVVPQSVFERIPDSEERQMKFVQEKIDEKIRVMNALAETDGGEKSSIYRQAKAELGKQQDELNALSAALEEKRGKKREKDEKKQAVAMQNAEVKAKEMLDREVDDVENFDDMGIDALLVDEAHEYKHLGFATAMQRGVKGVDPKYSKKSQGVFLKTQAVMEKKNGKNVVFATGTPISNTAAEIWTFMRYLMPADQMKEYGIYYFDDFVRNFGNIQQMLEFSTNGKFKENNRFSGYVNLPELVRIWSGVADTVLTREAGGVSDKIPEMEGGKAQDVFLPQTKALRSVMKFVRKRLDEFDKMSGKEKKENSHIPLTMYGIAKAAAVDARLVVDNAEDDPYSKTNEAVRQTLRSLEETKDYKGTVAIFADVYQNGSTGFNLYTDIRDKLIKEGVDPKEIVVMVSGMTMKKKLEIFDKVNRGEVRVILGSTSTLGTGVNIQERLHTLIHLDAPNRPMDYTQRNGRILRQGNIHKEMGKPVRILRFGVEDSLDVTAYQRLKTKGAIADSIMNGKKMMASSMENRSLEEDEDVFGDITAQLSGSEYAMLKNQAEKEVRKLDANYRQWQNDQTYIHNQIPKLQGQVKETEALKAEADKALDTLKKQYDAKKGITVNGTKYTDLESMDKFFKDVNQKVTEQMNEAKQRSDYQAERSIRVNVGGIDFDFKTTVKSRMADRSGQTTLTFSASHDVKYSCEALGLKDVPVSKGWLRNGLEDVLQNVVTGNDFKEKSEAFGSAIDRAKDDIEKLKAREGKTFEDADKLAEMRKRLSEYEELMKKEMAEKEAKYAQIDSEVKEADGVHEAVEEDEEDDQDTQKDNNKYRIREDEPPVRTGIGYKVFVLKDGKLYPPMVANEDREDTPTGVWLDGDTNEQLIVDKEGADQEQAGVEPWLRRYHVQAGGKGTQGGSGKLAYRPGWHLGEIPYALQFGRMNPVTGLRELFPKDFVWAEVEYADDVDYQKESDERMWYNKEGKRLSSPTHSMGGLNHMPWNGSYRYRTNPNPETDAWIITGAMRVNRILKPSEVDEIVEAAGREPQEREAGAVTDAMVERLNRGLMKRMDTSEAGKKQAALTLGRKLGVKVRIVDDAETLADEDKRKKERMRNAKGWFDTKSGEVVIVAGNNRSVQDVEQTVFHEIVGHRALREMIGEEKMDRFLDEVYSHAGKAVRERIAALAGKHGWNMREATEEYLAGLAEKGFEDFNAEEKSLWQKVRDFVARLLQGLKIPKSVTLNDNDLRYILWRGYQMQVERGALGEAENVVMKQRLGAGEFKFRDGETPESMEESVIKGAVALAQKHKDDVKLRDDAMRAIGGNMQKLRQAMALQKELDVNTAKGVGDLAKTLVANGWFEGATARDLNRLMTQVQQAVGKEDITQNVDAIMDLMTDNLLSQAQSDMAKLLKVKASRVNAQGVEVQGELDGDGKKLVDVLKAGLKMREREDLENAIEAASDRMGSEDDVTSEEAAIEYEGLCLAKRFMEDITDSKKELADLKKELKQAKEDFAAGKFADRAAYDEFVRSTEDAIRQNKLERMEAFRSLTGDLADRLRGSIARAKEFRAADKERVRSIQHNANSDMEGRPSDEHRRDTRAQKAMNSPVVRFFLKPLATFDQMLRLFGNKAQNGEGYLYNRFMRGWVDASEAERLGVRKSFETMDRKASRVFRRRMRWSDLYALERGMRKGYAVIRNGDGMQRVELTQGNMLYIYMANKMADGRMKLRKMGIKEEDVERITDIIDPRFTELADWMQEEFLVDKRSEYNEVYKRMFGTSMAAIENYFPLKILSNARSEKVDVGDGFDGESKPSTTTGSIIKRRRNGLALDVTGADAFSVLVEHIQNMEKWAAFAEFNRDVNTLLSYKRFRNQVMNMSSIYGGGKKLWNNFKDVCRIAAGTYHPVVGSDSVDSTFTNVSKGVTAAKISFRVFTALKQLLSSPAFVSEANPARLLADAATPWRAWNWAMKELPLFEKRWKSRQAGDSRLLPTEMDWRFWRNNLVEKLGQWGMSPNAFVDALTVAVGAHAIYRTKYGQYVREGYDAQWADRRAKQDATVLYNETQQSNENAFLSTMQLDRTVASVAFSVFRNSSMGYQRQMVDAIRNLKRAMTPGYRERSIAFMAKQHVRNGLESDQANAAATKDYNRGVFRDLTRLAVFGFVMQFAWNLGAYLPYLIGGGDDDDKDEFLKDAAVHALFGGVEGLTGGNLLSDGLNMAVSGQSLQNYDPSLLPLLNDVESIVRHFQSDQVAAANDVVNLLVQSGIGVNPQTLTDMAVAVWDACGGDARTQREATLCLMRVLSCPQSQLDKVYFDELGCNGTDASQLTPKELAERYAIYKVKRSAALTGWAYGNELKEKRLLTYEDKAKAMEKARLGKLGDRDVNALYLEYSEDAKQVEKMKEAIAAKGAYDAREAARLNAELARRPEYGRYRLFKRHDAMLDKLAKRWLAAGSAEEKAEIESRLLNEKERMVALLCDYDKPKIK